MADEIEAMILGFYSAGTYNDYDVLDFGKSQDVEAEFLRLVSEGDPDFNHFILFKAEKSATVVGSEDRESETAGEETPPWEDGTATENSGFSPEAEPGCVGGC